MAELGTVIAVVQLADRVVVLCKYWIGAFRDAPSDIRSIFLETSTLQTTLHNMKFLVNCDGVLSATIITLSQKNGPIDRCHDILKELISLIPPEVDHTSHDFISRQEKLATKLAWPFKRSTALKLLEELGRYKADITLAMMAESMQDLKAIKTKTTEIFAVLSEHQRTEFYQWLQQTDPSPIHNRSQSLIEEGTCSWIQRLPEWADWLAAKFRCLWIHGIPGAGKTVLASYLVEELRRHFVGVSKPKVATLYYYCYFGHNQDEAAPFLRWLITQLCRRSDTVSTDAFNLFKQGCEPSLPDLLNALSDAQEYFDAIYIVLDAVDESDHRDNLLKIIQDLVTDPRFCKIQLLATSREYIDIERVLQGISRPVSMSNSFIEYDIRCYVQSTLQKNLKFKDWPKYLLDEVEVALSTRAKGMFRWAVCQIDRLRRLPCDVNVVRNTLATLPKTLDETYERIFTEFSEEERFIVRQCLTWISFHGDLYYNGIPFAILLEAIHSEDKGKSEFGNEHFFNEESLRESCGCLLTVSPGLGFDIYKVDDIKAIRVVSFSHYTVREFLDSNRMLKDETAYFRLGPQVRLDKLSTVLLTALKYETKDSDLDLLERISSKFRDITSDFRSYCAVTSIYSIAHYPEEITSQHDLSRMTFRLLNPCGASIQPIKNFLDHCITKLRLRSSVDGSQGPFDFETLVWTAAPNATTAMAMILFSIMMLVDRFNGLAEKLIQSSEDNLDWIHEPLNFRLKDYESDSMFNFKGPMIEFFAQHRFGQDRLIWILDHGVAVPNPTALLYALVHEHDIESEYNNSHCLLRRIIDLGAVLDNNNYTTTPLQMAIARGDYEGVEVLLNAGAHPNNIGRSGRTRWREMLEYEHLRPRHENLEGLSALYICQNNMWNRCSKSKKQRLEALLLRFGARSFTAKQSPRSRQNYFDIVMI